MQLGPSYEMSRIVDGDRSRHQERDLAVRRALKDARRRDGMVSRIIGRLGRLRPVAPRRPAIVHDVHVLTDKVCRLADGSAGRVAIRESNGEWVEICVPA
jgi:hypothetical protein